MDQPTHVDVTDLAELAIALMRQQAAENRLLPTAARPAVGLPDCQQVNRVDRSGVALKGGWGRSWSTPPPVRSCVASVTPTTSISRSRCVATCRSNTNGTECGAAGPNQAARGRYGVGLVACAPKSCAFSGIRQLDTGVS